MLSHKCKNYLTRHHPKVKGGPKEGLYAAVKCLCLPCRLTPALISTTPHSATHSTWPCSRCCETLCTTWKVRTLHTHVNAVRLGSGPLPQFALLFCWGHLKTYTSNLVTLLKFWRKSKWETWSCSLSAISDGSSGGFISSGIFLTWTCYIVPIMHTV